MRLGYVQTRLIHVESGREARESRFARRRRSSFADTEHGLIYSLTQCPSPSEPPGPKKERAVEKEEEEEKRQMFPVALAPLLSSKYEIIT